MSSKSDSFGQRSSNLEYLSVFIFYYHPLTTINVDKTFYWIYYISKRHIVIH